jgi:hypothetical protein
VLASNPQGQVRVRPGEVGTSPRCRPLVAVLPFDTGNRRGCWGADSRRCPISYSPCSNVHGCGASRSGDDGNR